jgi:hypothetical protein
MPLDTAGQIQYREVVMPEGIRYQADPPVCHLCKQEITRETIGWVYLANNGRKGEQVECVECTACTLIRDGGPALRSFVERHHL